MNILVIGSEQNYKECISRFGNHHTFGGYSNPQHCLEEIKQAEILFDFRIHHNPLDAPLYVRVPAVFINTTIVKFEDILARVRKTREGTWFGFNGMPSFILHKDLEVCVNSEQERKSLEALCGQLQVGYTLVRDQIGMVTPRIICMIINEAYYTMVEKTASREDIDLAMKAGTNYPFGPFEWCNRIGAAAVCELLQAMHKATGDDRFKVCPALEQEAKVNLTKY